MYVKNNSAIKNDMSDRCTNTS